MILESVVQDGIRTITLNKPPANAIHYDMMHAVCAAFDEASADWDTKVVILQSANPRFFSGGWDIRADPPTDLPPAVPHYGSMMGREVFRSIYECGAPVIAKVGGIAVGAGFLYAALCDFIVAGRSAQFGQFEIKVGAVGGAGMLRRVMSEQAMRYFTWTGDLVSVEELVAMGAGIKVVDDEAIDDATMALAHKLASRDAKVIRHTKASFNQVEYLEALPAYTFEQMHSQIINDGSGRMGLQPDHLATLKGKRRGGT